MDSLLDLLEGPSRRRKLMAFFRRLWSGPMLYVLALLVLLWLNAAHDDLHIPNGWTQVIRTLIAVLIAGVIFLAPFLRPRQTQQR